MIENAMSDVTRSAIIPPAIKTVGSCCRDPFGVVSSVMLTLSVVILSALDFKVGLFLLPVILFDLLSTVCSLGKAKKQQSKFGLPFVKFAAVFGIIILVSLFTVNLLEHKGYITINNPWQSISDELPFPLNTFINKGFLGIDIFVLPLTLFFLGKLVSTCSLSTAIRRNLPKHGAQIFAAILMILSFSGLILDGLYRIGLVPSLYHYNSTTSENSFLMYIAAAVLLLAAISVLFQIIKTFRIHAKMRKLKNAF